MGRMLAAVGVTLCGVLVLDERYASTDRFAHIQRCSIAAEVLDWRPLWHDRQRSWTHILKFLNPIDNLSVNDRQSGFDTLDIFLGHGEIVLCERDNIR